MNIDINEILNQPFSFRQRNQLIPSEIRATWKISLVLIIFHLSAKKNMCSLKKLHVANWITKSEEHLQDFLHWTVDTSQIRPDIRLEPALDRAIEILVAEKLLKKTKGKLEITDKGISIAEKIYELDVFESEKRDLVLATKKMTEANVERIFKLA